MKRRGERFSSSRAPRDDRALYIAAAALIGVGFLVPLWHAVLAGSLLLVFLELPLLALGAALILDLLSGVSYGLFDMPLLFTALVALAWLLWSVLKRYLRTR